MSLFLTSDEIFDHDNKYNSRSNFSNIILPDFFQDAPFNISLKEIYFDPNFPSLPFLDAPFIITLVDPDQHKIEDFPQNIQDKAAFKTLFKNHNKNQIYAPLLTDIGEIDVLEECRITYEVHHRLNYAFVLSTVKDLNFKSKSELVSYLNKYMFPLHARKPLEYHKMHEKVKIVSNMNMYFSHNLLAMLGFRNIMKVQTVLPLLNFPSVFYNVTNVHPIVTIHRDSLAKMEEDSNLYQNYRKLSRKNPTCVVKLHYKVNDIPLTTKIEFVLELFDAKKRMVFDFDKHFKFLNESLREQFLTDVIMKTIETVEYTRKDMMIFKVSFTKIKNYIIRMNSDEWGGLITFKRVYESRVITPFHNDENIQMIHTIALAENIEESSSIFKKSFENIFLKAKLERMELDETLSNLYGVGTTLNFDSNSETSFPLKYNYFKCVRKELIKSFSFNPHSLSIMTLYDEIGNSDIINPIFCTEKEKFYFLKSDQIYESEEDIDLNCNHPKLIFVVGNFVQHSLYGSRQEKILNFFPMDCIKNDMLHHNFMNPIRLKTNEESNFHIKLLDQNLKPLKAGFGTPTLLSLKKSKKLNMFPVTVVSSDADNLKLYPANTPNSFTNKLSIPLIFPDRKNWYVSLRCIAFPKLCNITPQDCFINLTEVKYDNENDIQVHIALRPSYITNIHTLVSLIDMSINSEVSKTAAQNEIPKFEIIRQKVCIKTNGFKCVLSKALMRILGMTHSFLDTNVLYNEGITAESIANPELFLYQPKEIIVTSNIVEESFYAQSRPNILRIIPVHNHEKSSGRYNFIEFQEQDNIKLSVNRIQNIEIKLHTRKGELVSFVDENDVKIQLEFKEEVFKESI